MKARATYTSCSFDLIRGHVYIFFFTRDASAEELPDSSRSQPNSAVKLEVTRIANILQIEQLATPPLWVKESMKLDSTPIQAVEL